MLSFLEPYAIYLKIAKYAALALFAAWAFRVNELRGEHENQLDAVGVSLKSAGYDKIGYNDLPGDVNLLFAASTTYKENWASADAAVSDQNEAIASLGAAAQKSKADGVAAQQKADNAVADRDQWIAKAQTASARTTILPDNQELQQCTASLDSLYSENF